MHWVIQHPAPAKLPDVAAVVRECYCDKHIELANYDKVSIASSSFTTVVSNKFHVRGTVLVPSKPQRNKYTSFSLPVKIQKHKSKASYWHSAMHLMSASCMCLRTSSKEKKETRTSTDLSRIGHPLPRACLVLFRRAPRLASFASKLLAGAPHS